MTDVAILVAALSFCAGAATTLLWVATWERRSIDRKGRALLDGIDERTAAFHHHEDV